MTKKSELELHEPHPAAKDAMSYVLSFSMSQLAIWQGAFASCAIEGNRLAEICAGTLDRLLKREPVSDRYILGLAWAMRNGEEPDFKNGNR